MKSYKEIMEILDKKEQFTYDEEYSVFEYYKSYRDVSVRDKMIVKNRGLVSGVAKHFKTEGVEYEDLLQEGCFGLCKAFELFEHERGFKFSTYAVHWITSFISRYIGNCSRTIRIPVYLSDDIQKIKAVQNKFMNENGYLPDEKYIAEHTGLDAGKIVMLLEADKMTNPISIHMKIQTDDNEALLENIIEDTKNSHCMDDVIQKTDMECLWGIVQSVLTEKEFDVICRRMGHSSGEKESLEDIAVVYNVTRERIRQIESKALRKLNHCRYKKQLYEMLETYS